MKTMKRGNQSSFGKMGPRVEMSSKSKSLQYIKNNWRKIAKERRILRQTMDVHLPTTTQILETEGRRMSSPPNESEERRNARAQIDQMKDTSGFNHNMEAEQDFLRLFCTYH